MRGSPKVIEALNELLTMELTAVNQYFAHSKMCESWGYPRLAEKIRKDSFDEMKDAEEVIERILFLEGVPNMQRLGSVSVAESVAEVFSLQLESERQAIATIQNGIAVSLDENDQGSREFLAAMLPGEEQHVDWLETQLGLVRQVGEATYLAQQIRE